MILTRISPHIELSADINLQQCYNVTMLQCYNVTMLQCYNITMFVKNNQFHFLFVCEKI